MSNETKVPAIPAVTSDNVVDVVKSIKELLEVREGQRGNALDQVVTLRDLQDSGLASINITVGGRPPGGIVRITPPGGLPDLAVPPAILGFVADGGYQQVILGWDGPKYSNHSYVEIYRAASDPTTPTVEPTIGTAIKIGQSPGVMYIDACGSGKTFYYWVRAVSTAGVTGPYNSIYGTKAETAADVPYLLSTLNGALTESQLYKDLGARIDLVDSPENIAGSVNARVAAATTAAQGALDYFKLNDFKLVKDQSGTTASLMNTLLSSQTGVDAAAKMTALYDEIVTVHTALSNDPTDGAISLVEKVNTMAAQVDFGVDAQGLPRTASSYIQATQNVMVENAIAPALALKASAETVTNMISSVGLDAAGRGTPGQPSVTAQMSTLNSTVAAPGTGLVSQLSQMNARLGTDPHNTGISLEQRAEAQALTVGGLSAQYSIKIDNNGYVSGFGLSSLPASSNTGATGHPSSQFLIRADQFAIAPQSSAVDTNGALKANSPFFHLSADQSIWYNGAWTAFKAGTYINTAMIADATITQAKIGNLNAGAIKAGVFKGVSVFGDTIYGSSFYQGGAYTFHYTDLTTGYSSNGAPDVTKILASVEVTAPTVSFVNGIASFNNTAFQITNPGYANTVPFNVSGGVVRLGLTHLYSTLQSDNYSAGVSGWSINTSGACEFQTGIFRGAVYASSGTFAGSLSAATGTFSGALSAATGTFAGSLSAATGTFSGSLTAQAVNAVDTINLQGYAVTVPAQIAIAPSNVVIYSDLGSIEANVSICSATLTATGRGTATVLLNVDAVWTASSAAAIDGHGGTTSLAIEYRLYDGAAWGAWVVSVYLAGPERATGTVGFDDGWVVYAPTPRIIKTGYAVHINTTPGYLVQVRLHGVATTPFAYGFQDLRLKVNSISGLYLETKK